MPETDKALAKLEKFDVRGVQTLFRTVSRNHYNLLKMVDNKASIILTVNSIIITLLLAAVYMTPSEQIELVQANSMILLNCGMASMVFALLAMLPHKYLLKRSEKTGYKGSLYAGNYSKLPLEDYRAEMRRIMSTGNVLYDEMTTDLYYLGKSVRRKQILIIISVVVFLIGLIATIVHSLSHGVMVASMLVN